MGLAANVMGQAETGPRHLEFWWAGPRWAVKVDKLWAGQGRGLSSKRLTGGAGPRPIR